MQARPPRKRAGSAHTESLSTRQTCNPASKRSGPGSPARRAAYVARPGTVLHRRSLPQSPPGPQRCAWRVFQNGQLVQRLRRKCAKRSGPFGLASAQPWRHSLGRLLYPTYRDGASCSWAPKTAAAQHQPHSGSHSHNQRPWLPPCPAGRLGVARLIEAQRDDNAQRPGYPKRAVRQEQRLRPALAWICTKPQAGPLAALLRTCSNAKDTHGNLGTVTGCTRGAWRHTHCLCGAAPSWVSRVAARIAVPPLLLHAALLCLSISLSQ